MHKLLLLLLVTTTITTTTAVATTHASTLLALVLVNGSRFRLRIRPRQCFFQGMETPVLSPEELARMRCPVIHLDDEESSSLTPVALAGERVLGRGWYADGDARMDGEGAPDVFHECRGVRPENDDDDDPLMRGPMRFAGIEGPQEHEAIEGSGTQSTEPAPCTPPSRGRLFNSNGAFLTPDKPARPAGSTPGSEAPRLGPAGSDSTRLRPEEPEAKKSRSSFVSPVRALPVFGQALQAPPTYAASLKDLPAVADKAECSGTQLHEELEVIPGRPSVQ